MPHSSFCQVYYCLPNPMIPKIRGVGEGGTRLPSSKPHAPNPKALPQVYFRGECGADGHFSPAMHEHTFLLQLPNSLLQELPLWFLLGQGQRLLIRRPGLGCPA